MSNKYNSFGMTVAKVIEYFQSGCQTAATVTAQFGGSTVIQSYLDDVTYEVVGAMSTEILNKLEFVQLEDLTGKIPGGLRAESSTVTTGLAPVSDVLMVWEFGERPVVEPSNYNKLDTDYWSYALDGDSKAVITRSGQNWGEGTIVYASYTIDTTDSGFSMPSIAAIIKEGVVQRMGPKNYSDESAWEYLKMREKEYQEKLKMISDRDWIPDEMRTLAWWHQPEKYEGIFSVKSYRGA